MRKISILLSILFLILTGGCSYTHFFKGNAGARLSEDDAKKLLLEAEDAYADGAVNSIHRRWSDARDDFDKALDILSRIDISEQDPLIQKRMNALLSEIAYDYRFVLINSDTLTSASAPAVISLALESDSYTPKTRRRLSQLLENLPPATGESYNFPVVWNDRVKEKIVFFQTDAREPFTLWLGRSYRYLPIIKRIFAEEGLPAELAYLPLIESGFNPNAYSWAHAVGMWQFILGTGRRYGLHSNWWYDERRNPEKATYAAARYLKALYNMFGDWELALAAYNCGESRVKRAMKKQGTSNFWELDLPTQTENYVPLFDAALIIAKNPARYGFFPERQEPLTYDIAPLHEPVNLELVAECTDTTLNAIQDLNPELLRWCTPPDVGTYNLRVPSGKGDTFGERYAQIPDSRKTLWQKHKVKPGETLSHIAYRYGTSISALAKANKIKNKHKLRVGQVLLVPIPHSSGRAARQARASKSTAKKSSKSASSGYYKVKKGDTPSGIAEKLGVPLSKLLAANKMTSKSTIYQGQLLRIPGTAPAEQVVYHTVHRGETPAKIASNYGVSLSSLLAANKLTTRSTIYPGQKLKVSRKNVGTARTTQTTQTKIVHTVKKGETLGSIAQKYGVSTSNMVKWNNLRSKNSILHIGDKLVVMSNRKSSRAAPASASATQKKIIHRVKKGETLYAIAHKYSVTVRQIKKWNNKKSSALAIGEKLIIYGSSKEHTQKFTHTVKKGETLWQIARVYNTTPDRILTDNHISNPSKLKIGTKLSISTD